MRDRRTEYGTPPETLHGKRACIDMLDSASHILIAGQTGSGKSVLLTNFLYTATTWHPTKLELSLIDPKQVDLERWRSFPHCTAYADNVQGAIAILDANINRITARNSACKKNHVDSVKELTGYTQVWIVIDELADLMTTAKKEILPRLQRIAQLGRSAGIHLLCATQAPSRKIIPAELTLNFTHKIALHCDSAIESRQVIGEKGAEDLPQYGYCIIREPGWVHTEAVPMVPKADITERLAVWQRVHKKHGLRRLFA